MNLNYLFNSVANEQGVTPGTPEWEAGGIRAFSGQSGGHAAYGWKHTHLLEQKGGAWVRAVIANYGHRRAYYLNEPKRYSAYYIGCRPEGWEPEDSQDFAGDPPSYWNKGPVLYFGEKGKVAQVSGPDALHFHIGPLIEVIDHSNVMVMAQGQRIPARIPCEVMVRFLMDAFAGMYRRYMNTQGDRGDANFFKCAAQAASRGLMNEEDILTAIEVVNKVVVKKHINGPGHGFLFKDEFSNPPKYTFQVYNGLFWLIPSLYDFYNAFPSEVEGENKKAKETLETVLTRMSKWMLDLYKWKGDLQVGSLIMKDEVKDWSSPKEEISPYVKEVKEASNWHEIWAFRAVSVAAELLQSSELKKLETEIASRHDKTTELNRPWFVDYNLNYV